MSEAPATDETDGADSDRGEVLAAALADRAAERATAGLGLRVASRVDAACAALADDPQSIEPCADVLGGELGELLPAEAGNEVLLDDGGVAGVDGLSELVDGDVLQPVRQLRGEAAWAVIIGRPWFLAAIFSVSLAGASLRELQ
jgi:hypothetical protein